MTWCAGFSLSESSSEPMKNSPAGMSTMPSGHDAAAGASAGGEGDVVADALADGTELAAEPGGGRVCLVASTASFAATADAVASVARS